MKSAATKLEFHRRVSRQLKRLMSKYTFQVYKTLIIEWKYGLDISCILNLYAGNWWCTGVRFVHYGGDKKPITFTVEQISLTSSPERVAVNIVKRVKNIMFQMKALRKARRIRAASKQ
jgi:hypothetical protein